MAQRYLVCCLREYGFKRYSCFLPRFSRKRLPRASIKASKANRRPERYFLVAKLGRADRFAREVPLLPWILRGDTAQPHLRQRLLAMGFLYVSLADFARRYRGHGRGVGGGSQLAARGFLCVRSWQMANPAKDCLAVRKAWNHHWLYSSDGSWSWRSCTDDAGRCYPARNRTAFGLGVSLFPRIEIFHASRIPNLLARFSKPKQ